MGNMGQRSTSDDDRAPRIRRTSDAPNRVTLAQGPAESNGKPGRASGSSRPDRADSVRRAGRGFYGPLGWHTGPSPRTIPLMERRQIRFHGRVQGVGFRVTARAIADEFAVSGWVRNEPDGTV